MAFHLPKEPIRTKREFLLYLLATAAGVLLALSLERAGAWWHTRTLVNEARHNLSLEIAENRKRIENWRSTVPQISKNLTGVIEFAGESLRTGKSGKTSLTVGFGLIVLSASAWKAAETTGATAHMGYREARGFAQLYSLQEELTRTQANVMDDVAQATGFFSANRNPTRDQRPQDLDRLNDRVRTMAMRISFMDNLAKGLDEACAKIQRERSDGL